MMGQQTTNQGPGCGTLRRPAIRGSGVALLWLATGVLLAASTLSGCSSMVDSQPPAEQPETNVRNYYALLTTAGMHYDYVSSVQAAGAAARVDTLHMKMEGSSNAAYLPDDAYTCEWSYAKSKSELEWYYALCDSEAVDLGSEYGLDHWVDLAQPIAKDRTWTFTRTNGEQVTAKVMQFGGTAMLDGKTYDNVVMVSYSGTKGSHGVKWFSRGTGLIYSNVTTSGTTYEDRFLSKWQE